MAKTPPKYKKVPEFRLLADSLGLKAGQAAEWLEISIPYFHALMNGNRQCTEEIREKMECAVVQVEEAARKGAPVKPFSRAIQRRMLELHLLEREDSWMENR